jgi:hypothetical protein
MPQVNPEELLRTQTLVAGWEPMAQMIDDLRDEHGMKRLARMFGVSDKAVYSWRVGQLPMLANALKVRGAWLELQRKRDAEWENSCRRPS